MTDVRPLLQSAQLKALEAYWRSKMRGDVLPARRDIDPWEMRSFLRRVFLITVTQNPLRFWFRMVGTTVAEEYGADITGRYLDEIDLDDVQRDIEEGYRTVALEGRPVYSRCDYMKQDRRHLAYERLLLPLSSDGKMVDMILGAAAPIGRID